MLDLKVIPALQVLLSVTIMIALAKIFPSANYTFVEAKPVAIVISLVAVLLGIIAVFSFKKHETTVNPSTPEKASLLVNTGVFAYSRNPMYFALLLVLIALAIKLQNSACFTVLPFFMLYITQFQIKPEEQALNKLFGDEYKIYCQQVRRWL